MKFTITLALAGEQLDQEQAEAFAGELVAEWREHHPAPGGHRARRVRGRRRAAGPGALLRTSALGPRLARRCAAARRPGCGVAQGGEQPALEALERGRQIRAARDAARSLGLVVPEPACLSRYQKRQASLRAQATIATW